MNKKIITMFLLLPCSGYASELDNDDMSQSVFDPRPHFTHERDESFNELTSENKRLNDEALRLKSEIETLNTRLDQQLSSEEGFRETVRQDTQVELTILKKQKEETEIFQRDFHERYNILIERIKTNPVASLKHASKTYETLAEIRANKSATITRAVSVGALGFAAQTAITDPGFRSMIEPAVHIFPKVSLPQFVTVSFPTAWKPSMPDLSKAFTVAAIAGVLTYLIWPKKNHVDSEIIQTLVAEVAQTKEDIALLNDGYRGLDSLGSHFAEDAILLEKLRSKQQVLEQHCEAHNALLVRWLCETGYEDVVEASGLMTQEQNAVIADIIVNHPVMAEKVKHKSRLKRLFGKFYHAKK